MECPLPRAHRRERRHRVDHGQSGTQDAIQAELVVSADPATGAVSGLDQIRPAFVKRDEIAWIGTHRHAPDGNQPYVPSYLFVYTFVLPPGAHAVQVPDDGRLHILAITASDQPPDLKAAGVLYARELPTPGLFVWARGCSSGPRRTSTTSRPRRRPPASRWTMTRMTHPGAPARSRSPSPADSS